MAGKMKLVITIVLISSLYGVLHGGSIQPFEGSNIDSKVKEGEAQYNKMIKNSKMPSGSCWKETLENLEMGCRDLTEEMQGRL